MSEPASEDVHAARAPVPVALAYRSPGAFLIAYATQLVKGGLFIESPAPPPAGTRLALRLAVPPATSVAVDGVVTWTRAGALAAGQTAGMAVTLSAPLDALGDAVDGLAFGFQGFEVLLGTGEAAPRAILSRYLRSILSCSIIDLPEGDEGNGGAAAFDRVDLAVIDVDSSGPASFDLHARLRAHPRASSAPVVALAQQERDRTRALRLGFDDALANPPVLADLQAAVLRCLARPLTVIDA